MAVTKDICADKIDKVREKGLDVANTILEANPSPSNAAQFEAIRVALEMYKTFSIKP